MAITFSFRQRCKRPARASWRPFAKAGAKRSTDMTMMLTAQACPIDDLLTAHMTTSQMMGRCIKKNHALRKPLAGTQTMPVAAISCNTETNDHSISHGTSYSELYMTHTIVAIDRKVPSTWNRINSDDTGFLCAPSLRRPCPSPTPSDKAENAASTSACSASPLKKSGCHTLALRLSKATHCATPRSLLASVAASGPMSTNPSGACEASRPRTRLVINVAGPSPAHRRTAMQGLSSK